jgi:hypothetical protein
MRAKTLLVLITFVLLIFAPFKFNVQFSPDKKNISLFTLDVCHASGGSLPTQVDILCVSECAFSLLLFESTCLHAGSNSFFQLSIIPFQEEHPPKA